MSVNSNYADLRDRHIPVYVAVSEDHDTGVVEVTTVTADEETALERLRDFLDASGGSCDGPVECRGKVWLEDQLDEYIIVDDPQAEDAFEAWLFDTSECFG